MNNTDNQYVWIPLEFEVDDPLCVRGMKKAVLPPPPDGMEWAEVTAAEDKEQKFILVKVDE